MDQSQIAAQVPGDIPNRKVYVEAPSPSHVICESSTNPDDVRVYLPHQLGELNILVALQQKRFRTFLPEHLDILVVFPEG